MEKSKSLDNVTKELQELLKEDFVAVEMGTWNDNVNFIYVIANYCSLNQAMEIARISGDADPLFTTDNNYRLRILVDLKNNDIKE